MERLKLLGSFVTGTVSVLFRGSRGYFVWTGCCLVAIAIGLGAYANQVNLGLITTNMRDQLSWGFYIGNFAYLVGVAAAAVVLVIPAYVYEWGPIRNVVLLGELLAVAAIVMCILFVTVDLGRPERIWHLVPLIGTPNYPYSLLVWDILALNAYFLINVCILAYLLFHAYMERHYNPRHLLPLVFLSIPLAIGIHTVTAFLFMGLKARPFWNTAILAPRFLASAFCSGPALLVLIFQIIRRTRRIRISNEALDKIGELLAYAMAANLFFIAVEAFTDFYPGSAHAIHARFQWFGVDGLTDIAVYTWLALFLDTAAFLILILPNLRRRLFFLNIACVFAASGVFIEKGMGLLLPGMTPGVLGDIYAYEPSLNEVQVSIGVWGVGALLFTLMVKLALAANMGELHRPADEFRHSVDVGRP